MCNIICRPFTVHEGTEGYELYDNPYSWNEAADVLYVDQPLRTGFSVAAKDAKFVSSEKHIAKQFHGFLKSFINIFPEYENIPVYLTGESYAGMYIPFIAEDIVRYNADIFYRKDYWPQGTDDEEKLINLQGIAIGNGMIDFITQEKAYAEYAYTHGLIPIGVKKVVDQLYRKCIDKAGGLKNAYKMTRLDFVKCGLSSHVFEAAGKPNEYNIGTFHHNTDIIRPDNIVHKFFNDQEVQVALHVRGSDLPGLNFNPEHRRLTRILSGDATISSTISYENESKLSQSSVIDTTSNHHTLNTKSAHKNGHAANEEDATTTSPSMQPQQEEKDHVGYYGPVEWKACDLGVSLSLLDDHPVSAVPSIHYIAQFISVFLYSGELDSTINTLGTIHTLEQNEWLGEKWKTANRALWKFADDVAGEYFQLKTISLLIIRNAGHMMPLDKPATALEMITKFLDRTSFADVILLSDKDWADKIRKENDISKKDYLELENDGDDKDDDDDEGMTIASGQKDGRVKSSPGAKSKTGVDVIISSSTTVAHENDNTATTTTTASTSIATTATYSTLDSKSTTSFLKSANPKVESAGDSQSSVPSNVPWIVWIFLLLSSPAVLLVYCVGRIGSLKRRYAEESADSIGLYASEDQNDESKSLKYGNKVTWNKSFFSSLVSSSSSVILGHRRYTNSVCAKSDSFQPVTYQDISTCSNKDFDSSTDTIENKTSYSQNSAIRYQKV